MLYGRLSNAARPVNVALRPCLRYTSSNAASQTRDAAPLTGTATTYVGESIVKGPQTTLTWPPSSVFASYDVGIPPSIAQLGFANRYFEKSNPTFLSSAAKFRTLPASAVPEVAFLGRSNVGKSSLLNALLHRTTTKIANVSKKPGRTKAMNAFGVGGVKVVKGEHESWEARGGLVIMDMPGYGKASQEQWGTEIVKYLTGRKQLRRTFVLIDSEHGVKAADLQLLKLLWQNYIPYQVVMSKIDKVVMPRSNDSPERLARRLRRLPEIFKKGRTDAQSRDAARRSPPTDIITCSSEVDYPPRSGRKIGIENLRWAVLCAAGLEVTETGERREIQADMLLNETSE